MAKLFSIVVLLLASATNIVQAAAELNKLPLYEYLHSGKEYVLPVPMMNILNVKMK